MPPRTPQASLLMACRIPADITGTTGKAAQTALVEWGAALAECDKLNAAKAAHIRRIHQLPD